MKDKLKLPIKTKDDQLRFLAQEVLKELAAKSDTKVNIPIFFDFCEETPIFQIVPLDDEEVLSNYYKLSKPT